MNYTELVAAIKDYVEYEETTFVSNIDLFIKNAETKILRLIKIPEIRKNVTGSMTAGTKFVQRPSDFLTMFSFSVVDTLNSKTSFLLEKDVSFMREAYPTDIEGLPKYYAQYQGDSSSNSGFFLIGPTPDLAYTIELSYYHTPESIADAASGTSWLGDNAAPALLFGSVLEAYVYMKGDGDVMQMYQQRYADAMQSIFRIDLEGKVDEYTDGRET